MRFPAGPTHIPLHHRVSMEQPFSQIGLAIEPPEPFVVPRQAAKAKPRPVTLREIAAWATQIGNVVASFTRPLKPLLDPILRVGTTYAAIRQPLMRGSSERE